MQLTLISDLHNLYKQLGVLTGETLIIAGDLEVYEFSSELNKFIKWLDKQEFKTKMVVAGNHDGFIYRNNNISKETLNKSCIYLENSGIEIDGIKFWGSPYTPQFGNWFFMKERGEELKRNWDLVPNDTNILIGHGMPYKIMDEVLNFNDTLENVGDFDLLNRIKELKELKLYVGGHLHLNGGKIKKEFGIKFANASIVDEEYKVVNKPIIMEIK